MQHVNDLNDDFEESMVFYRPKYLKMRVPVRFESRELEQSYKEYVRKEADHWTVALALLGIGAVIQVVGVWEDISAVVRGKGEPWNYMLGCVAVAFVFFYAGCSVVHYLYPTFFTDKRRLLYLLITLTRYAFCNRPVALAVFRIEWPYVATGQFKPPIIWLVVASMIICSMSCQTWCFRCKDSFFICCYSVLLLIIQTFALPAGREALQQCVLLTVLVMIHLLNAYSAHIKIESAERRIFLHLRSSKQSLVEERVKRYEAERRAEEPILVEETPRERGNAHDEPQASEVASRLSSVVFRGLHKASSDNVEAQSILMHELRDLGEEEHCLIQPKELALHADRILGAGNFGSVVVGTWMSGEVAVKVPKVRESGECHPLALEIRHLRKLRHPCIVSFLGMCIGDDREVLLVEELVVGYNLSVFVANLGSFANQCVQFRQHALLDVSAALHYLHSQRPAIVHGDLKPENIIIDRHLVAKLTDFGFARRSAHKDKMPGGTRNWLESRLRQDSRGKEVHASVDIWALGGIAFFICAGVGPWKGNTIFGSPSMEEFGCNTLRLWRGDEAEGSDSPVVEKQQHFLKSPDDLDRLSALCYRCMAPDVDQRPTARDVNRELLSWRSARNEGGVAQRRACADPFSSGATLNDQITAVRAIVSGMRVTSTAEEEEEQEEVSLDALNEIKDVLHQQFSCLQKMLGSDSDDDRAFYIMQVLLETVFRMDGISKVSMSL